MSVVTNKLCPKMDRIQKTETQEDNKENIQVNGNFKHEPVRSCTIVAEFDFLIL